MVAVVEPNGLKSELIFKKFIQWWSGEGGIDALLHNEALNNQGSRYWSAISRCGWIFHFDDRLNGGNLSLFGNMGHRQRQSEKVELHRQKQRGIEAVSCFSCKPYTCNSMMNMIENIHVKGRRLIDSHHPLGSCQFNLQATKLLNSIVTSAIKGGGNHPCFD